MSYNRFVWNLEDVTILGDVQLKHLPGKHNQQLHDPHKGNVEAALSDLSKLPKYGGKRNVAETPFPKASAKELMRVGLATKKSGIGLFDMEDANIPVADIVATQAVVYPSAVKKYILDPNKESDVPPTATKYNGKYYLTEGHHRAAASKLLGEEFVSGVVYNLDKGS